MSKERPTFSGHSAYTTRPDGPNQFTERSEEYFAQCEAEGRSPTINGLAYFTGFPSATSMSLLYHHAKWKKALDRARTYIAAAYEARLHTASPSGAVFALKNIAGWSDKKELVVEQNINVSQPSTPIEHHRERIRVLALSVSEPQAVQEEDIIDITPTEKSGVVQ